MSLKYHKTLLALASLMASVANAQTTGTWNVDAAGNWSTLGSWTSLTGGVVPNAVDAAVTFGTLITAARTVTLDVDVSVGSLTFNEDVVNANAYSMTFNASRTMTFDVSSGNASVTTRGAGGYQIGTQGAGQVVLNDNLAISAGSGGGATSDGGSFNINSQIVDGNAGAKGLILSTLSSNDGTGTATSGFRGTNLRSTTANTFSGGVTVDSGYLGLIGHIGNAGTGAITLNASDSSAGIGTVLSLKTSGGTLTNNIVFGNSGASAGGSPRLAISLADASAQNYIFTGTITGAIGNQQIRFSTSGNVAGSVTLSGDGSGLTSGTGGSLHVRSGILMLNHANALTTGNALGTTSGGFNVGNFSNGATGSAQLLTNGFDVAARITTQQTTTAAQTSNDNIVVGGYHTTGTATFSGIVTMGRIVAGTRQFQLTSAAGGTTVFSGVISDGAVSGSASAFLPVYKVGGGIVRLSNTNTYSGGTFINAGTLQLGANGGLPASGAITLAGGTLASNGFTSATLGSLSLTANSAIDLTGGGAFVFADSSANNWGSNTLSVSGTFVSGSSLKFGSSATGLTSGQLALISIAGFNTVGMNSSGFITAVASAIPEPSTYAALAGAVMLGFAATRRRRSAA